MLEAFASYVHSIHWHRLHEKGIRHIDDCSTLGSFSDERHNLVSEQRIAVGINQCYGNNLLDGLLSEIFVLGLGSIVY